MYLSGISGIPIHIPRRIRPMGISRVSLFAQRTYKKRSKVENTVIVDNEETAREVMEILMRQPRDVMHAADTEVIIMLLSALFDV